MSHSSAFQPSCHFHSRRSPVYARHGAVCSSQPLASQIGLEILKSGGNAADACVAVAGALGLLEPCSTGLGGDMFAIYYDASNRRVSGINGSGRAPFGLDETKLKPEDKNRRGDGLHPMSVHCVTVPGAAKGWEDVHKQWGSKKLSFIELLQPTIDLARNGTPLSPLTCESWHRSSETLRRVNNVTPSNPCVLLPNGRAPAVGEIYTNVDLARSMEELGRDGAEAWYAGRVGQAIVGECKARGSFLEMEDLTRHESTFPTPIKVNYKGVDIWEIPPNGQGLTALLALNILTALDEKAEKQQQQQQQEQVADKNDSTSSSSNASSSPLPSLASLGHNSSAYLHRVIESLRLAFADTRYYVSDMDHAHALGEDNGATYKRTLEGLLSMDYARQRAERFDPNETNLNHPYGSPVFSSNTVSFVCVDKDGNACSFINSNYTGFGSHIVPRGCGFSLQSRGANFTLGVDGDGYDGRHPNRLAGGKRPYHTIIPGMATKDGALYCPFSVMGAFNQPQGHVQLLLNLIEFGMDPQSALDEPRFCIESGLAKGEVLMEEGMKEEVMKELQQR